MFFLVLFPISIPITSLPAVSAYAVLLFIHYSAIHPFSAFLLSPPLHDSSTYMVINNNLECCLPFNLECNWRVQLAKTHTHKCQQRQTQTHTETHTHAGKDKLRLEQKHTHADGRKFMHKQYYTNAYKPFSCTSRNAPMQTIPN